MDKTKRRWLPLDLAYKFGQENGLGAEIAEIRDMKIPVLPPDWPNKWKEKTVRKAYIVELFQRKEILLRFNELYWHSDEIEAKTNSNLDRRTEYIDFLAERESGDQQQSMMDEEDDEDSGLHFAMESHLQDILVKNLQLIEAGLSLYRAGDTTGREFRIDGGYRIDILAIDRDKRFVVIELKRRRGKRGVIGQLLQYMSWVDLHLPNAPCRGIIISQKITDELLAAVRTLPHVSLLEYNLSILLTSVGADGRPQECVASVVDTAH